MNHSFSPKPFLCSIPLRPFLRPDLHSIERRAQRRSKAWRFWAPRHRRNFDCLFCSWAKKHRNYEEPPFDRSEHVVTLVVVGNEKVRAPMARSAYPQAAIVLSVHLFFCSSRNTILESNTYRTSGGGNQRCGGGNQPKRGGNQRCGGGNQPTVHRSFRGKDSAALSRCGGGNQLALPPKRGGCRPLYSPDKPCHA
jgi:hypothetical protein